MQCSAGRARQGGTSFVHVRTSNHPAERCMTRFISQSCCVPEGNKVSGTNRFGPSVRPRLDGVRTYAEYQERQRSIPSFALLRISWFFNRTPNSSERNLGTVLQISPCQAWHRNAGTSALRTVNTSFGILRHADFLTNWLVKELSICCNNPIGDSKQSTGFTGSDV